MQFFFAGKKHHLRTSLPELTHMTTQDKTDTSVHTYTHDSIQLAECNLDSNLKLKTPTSTDSPKKWWKKRSCWCGDVCPLWSVTVAVGDMGSLWPVEGSRSRIAWRAAQVSFLHWCWWTRQSLSARSSETFHILVFLKALIDREELRCQSKWASSLGWVDILAGDNLFGT